jgi:streptogramin lyase
VVEALESRRLLAVTFNEYPVPADFGLGYYCVIVRGPDDNLWFTGDNGKIGMIDPTTHAVAEFPVPTKAISTASRPGETATSGSLKAPIPCRLIEVRSG